MTNVILKHFPKLTELQIEQFNQLDALYKDWNSKINVISRKDIDNLFEHHILHSLAIAKVVQFKEDTDILDLGTGGGLPGIPLAILYPHAKFLLIDGRKKKCLVAQEIATALKLENVEVQQIRAEELKKRRFDFVICRAVASIDKLVMWSRPLIKKAQKHVFPNGLLALKGGNLKPELKLLHPSEYVEFFPVDDFFEGEFYNQKWVVYVQG